MITVEHKRKSEFTLRNNTREQVRIDRHRVMRVLGSSKAHHTGLTVQEGDEESTHWRPMGAIPSLLAAHDHLVVHVGEDFVARVDVSQIPKGRDFVMEYMQMGPYTIEVLQERTRRSFFNLSMAVHDSAQLF